MNRRIYILFLVVLLYSCKQKHVEVYNLNEYILSDNHKALLSDNPKPRLIFPIENSFDSVPLMIQKQLKKCYCEDYFMANYKLELTKYSSFNFRFSINNYHFECCEQIRGLACFLPTKITILLNNENAIFTNGEGIISIDSLHHHVKSKYLKYREEEMRFVLFQFNWDSKSNINIRKEVLMKIGLGFLLAANILSTELFSKDISDLTNEELDILYSHNRTHFTLYYDKFIASPSPPRYYK